MRRFIKNFAQAQCGAVTVDWVVLTACLVGLTLLLLGTLHDTSISTLDELGQTMIARFGSG